MSKSEKIGKLNVVVGIDLATKKTGLTISIYEPKEKLDIFNVTKEYDLGKYSEEWENKKKCFEKIFDMVDCMFKEIKMLKNRISLSKARDIGEYQRFEIDLYIVLERGTFKNHMTTSKLGEYIGVLTSYINEIVKLEKTIKKIEIDYVQPNEWFQWLFDRNKNSNLLKSFKNINELNRKKRKEASIYFLHKIMQLNKPPTDNEADSYWLSYYKIYKLKKETKKCQQNKN